MNYEQLMNLSGRSRKRAEQCRNGLSHDVRADIFEALADDFEAEANSIVYPLDKSFYNTTGGCQRR